MKIRNRYTCEIIYEDNSVTMKDTVINAVSNGVSLSYADLSYADLSYADLSYADLSYADLIGVDFRGANLRGVDFTGADLSDVDLRDVDFTGACFTGAMSYYCFTAYDTSRKLVHCVKHEEGWMVQEESFWGTLDELETKVKETHNSKVCLANIELLRSLT